MINKTDHRYESIVIDGNGLFWRSACACAKKIENVEDNTFVYTHVILDFLKRVKEIQEQFGYVTSKVYFLFDNPKSKISARQLIDDHYKSHRHNENVPKEFWDTLALLEMILQCYSNNFVIMKLDCAEADDLVYPLIMQRIKEEKVLLISADMDWSRALSLKENIHWFDYSTLYWHKNIFKDEYGFFPERNKVKFYKTIKGDHSDDIKPSIPYLPKEVLLHIVNHYDDINVFVRTYNQDEDIPKQWKVKIIENRSKILSNYALVDFVPVEQDIESFTFHCKENIGELRYWYDLLDLPFEYRMEDKSEKESSGFLKKPKMRRIKRIILEG